MHELGIVFHIIERIEEVGAENHLKQVSSVILEVGEVSSIIDSYLLDCWKWAADRSDLLRGSQLLIEKIPAVTLCQTCQKTYGTVAHGRTCPHCGSSDTVLISGNEVNIKELTAI
ncbi:MAG: hydrogenase maturation nickel metallochaperone HypA [Firmicutes bacterium]|nr:hydrogenase maturation nickel metallochaperone HypA [Bacillota bacterium]